jgi:hypothetical protein
MRLGNKKRGFSRKLNDFGRFSSQLAAWPAIVDDFLYKFGDNGVHNEKA